MLSRVEVARTWPLLFPSYVALRSESEITGHVPCNIRRNLLPMPVGTITEIQIVLQEKRMSASARDAVAHTHSPFAPFGHHAF